MLFRNGIKCQICGRKFLAMGLQKTKLGSYAKDHSLCLECGFIVSSRTFEDFTPIGFIEDKTNGIADYIKLLKKHNPDLTEEKLINRLNLFTDKPEKEILRAVRNDTRRNHRRKRR